jgi:hypothetical protein
MSRPVVWQLLSPRSDCLGTDRCARRGAINSLAVQEESMGFGRGALLWLLGVPLPIIILLALFWHH